ncbi:MAG: serine hydrolase domain-containing protein [Sphingobium sp.]
MSKAIDQLCGKYVTDGPLSHLHLFLSVDGRILIDRCHGDARADGTPLTGDSLYRMASMTKPVTIAAVLKLVEEGRLALDMPVARLLPEMAAMTLWTGEVDPDGAFLSRPCERAMTIFDLLRHSAGFTYSIHGESALDRAYALHNLDNFQQRRTGDEYAAVLAELPLLFAPGERFHYSASIDLLGVVLERATGQRAEDAIHRLLFEPLGMKDSFFVVPPECLDRLTDAWFMESEGAPPTLYDRGGQSRWRITPKSVSTGAGLVSSVRDYHRFLTMILRGGEIDGTRILSRQSVDLMLRNHLPGGGDLVGEGAVPPSETPRAGVGMGLGGAVLLDPVRAGLPGSVGTWFWGGIVSTGFFLDPVRRMIGLVMTQLMPSGMTRVREDFRRVVYDAMAEEV